MKTVKISLNSIDKVKSFVNDITKFDVDFDLVSGRYVIDAKSIMGIFSLDLSKPIDLNIHADNDIDTILAVLKPYIVEYYELTDEMRNQRDENGDYAYNYGVTLNYIFPVDRLMKIMNESMPLHIVKKAIPYVDKNGDIVKPAEPNGYKFETLALDMIAFMGTCLPFEVEREKEFAPIKNATGNDSIDSARELLKQNGYTL